MCVELESSNHLLFQCLVSAFVWSLLASVDGWPAGPLSELDLLAIFKKMGLISILYGWELQRCCGLIGIFETN
jgi:hypothetical protein